MSPLHGLVVYESMFGNTRAVAEAVAEGMSLVLPAEAVEVSAASSRPVADVSLLVVGGPTHAFGLSRPATRADAASKTGLPIESSGPGLREWLEGIGREDTSGMAAAAFDTRISYPRVPGSAAKAAARRLRRSGITVLEVKSFYVVGTTGPLVAGERERARAWGSGLAATVDGTDSVRR
jgi:hypothetical protein